MSYVFPEIRQASDEVLQTAFIADGLSSDQRIRQLHATSWKLGNVMLDNPEQSDTDTANVLYGAAILGCLNSLEVVASGKQHAFDTAQSVFHDGLKPIAQYVMEHRLYRSSNNDLRGTLSEISILSSIWWAIAYGQTSPDSYATFTRIDQDRGRGYGRKQGVDIMYREGGSDKAFKAKRHSIQVKSSYQRTHNQYAPHIKVIVPNGLVRRNDRGHAVEALMYRLSCNDQSYMSDVWELFTKVLNKKRL